MDGAHKKVPSSAGWLGGLGAVPFAGLAGAVAVLTGEQRMMVIHALLAYGATILAFLGGIHWGLAIGTHNIVNDGKLAVRLILSVMPSLTGWAALLVPDTTGLWILAIAFAAMLWADIRATQLGLAPPWYPKLRVPLTCVVVAALIFGAIS